ncbi:c-di-GMP-binding flagellar brake protein YcgR, contains PilZNR and PilZ domains [Roseateles sp. YR242]|uniref:flagellar brake protein n=1 Tax=Roseateles sp. YR242 TaxID=1855305 RepID=UPI0008D71E2C|nr:flagellar brake protein [Roseateles sp. YR242]SEL45863.1 c-di-GMP-binding flagellar brake protein YcgR, contains PilZNR and PilZ domains [Roseateles sp. YR242]
MNDRSSVPTATPDAADADFRLDAPGEIMSWLRELLQSQSRVQLSTPDGEAVHTVLRALDTPHGMLTFEAPQDRTAAEPVLASTEVMATAYLDRIKLQFDLPGLVGVRGTGTEVLRAPLPQRIYRFQRRQAYRVQSQGQLFPALRLSSVEGVRIRVVNVSGGGLALQWPARGTPGVVATLPPPPAQGEEVMGTLELEREVNFSVLLRVQHVTPGEGEAPHHLGCAFVSLSPSAARALQLFIDQAQKRERLMKRPA